MHHSPAPTQRLIDWLAQLVRRAKRGNAWAVLDAMFQSGPTLPSYPLICRLSRQHRMATMLTLSALLMMGGADLPGQTPDQTAATASQPATGRGQEEKKRWSLLTPSWPFHFGKKKAKEPASDPFSAYGTDQQRALSGRPSGETGSPPATSAAAAAGERALPVAPRAYPWPAPVDSHSGSAAFLPPGAVTSKDVALPIPASPPITNQQALVDNNHQAPLAERLRQAYEKQQATQTRRSVAAPPSAATHASSQPVPNRWPVAAPAERAVSASYGAVDSQAANGNAPSPTQNSPYFDPSQQPDYDRQFLPSGSAESSRRSWSEQLQAIAAKNATAADAEPQPIAGTPPATSVAAPASSAYPTGGPTHAPLSPTAPSIAQPPHANPPPVSAVPAPTRQAPASGGSFPTDSPGYVPATWPSGSPSPATTAGPPAGYVPPSPSNSASAPTERPAPAGPPYGAENRVVTPPALRLANNGPPSSGVPPAKSPPTPSQQAMVSPQPSSSTGSSSPSAASTLSTPATVDAGLEAYEAAEIESLIRPGRATFDSVPPPEIKTPAGVPSFALETDRPETTTDDDSDTGQPGQLDVESRVLAIVGDQSILAADLLWQINLMLAPYVGKATEEQIEEQRQILDGEDASQNHREQAGLSRFSPFDSSRSVAEYRDPGVRGLQ